MINPFCILLLLVLAVWAPAQAEGPGLQLTRLDGRLSFELDPPSQGTTWLLQFSRDGETWDDLVFLEEMAETGRFGADFNFEGVPEGGGPVVLFRAARFDRKNPSYRDFLAARMRWREQAFPGYTYVVSNQGQLGYRARYRVEDGTVTSMEVLDEPPSFVTVPDDTTVDDWFDEVAWAFESEAFLIDVDWDQETGYPARAFIDYDERIADEERRWVISELIPLEIGR